MQKILIIDDDRTTRLVIQKTLEKLGYQVILAEHGAEGLALARAELPHLIICDVTMPVMDGFETFQEFRNDPQLSPIPFVFLTADPNPEHLIDKMKLSEEDYIPKPFSLSKLLSVLNVKLKK
ncbi:MAG: response regulator [bacterium]